MNRRKFLSLSALATASMTRPVAAFSQAAQQQPGSFDFVFMTDTHIQPELDAAHGCGMCFRKIQATVKADFAIQGGDHVFDALGVDRQRAHSLFDLYDKTEQDLGMKVHHAIGNHDVFGVYAKSGIGLSDPGFGKQMFKERIGSTYYSFDHKGYHFIVLDSIQITADRDYVGGIDDDQLAWLKKDLAGVVPGTPMVVTSHIPLVTGFLSYVPPGGKSSKLVVPNAYQVLPLFDGHNVLAVLQGHTHINEVVRFKGIPYLTGGAVSGNWWHGTHLGTPEGFTVVTLRNGKAEWNYQTYGFKSIDPQNT